ncbi:MAG: hypothetical protein ACRCSN_12740 [Dermatophilaceae bacterium]
MHRHLALQTAAGAALVLLLAGCSDDPDPVPADSASGPSTSASPGSPTPSASALPVRLTLTRTGGADGFADVLFVQSDGAVVGSTNAGAVSCRAPAELTGALANGTPPSAPPPAGTDRVEVVLIRGNGEVQLGGAQGRDPVSEAARALLDDVQKAEGARTVCR